MYLCRSVISMPTVIKSLRRHRHRLNRGKFVFHDPFTINILKRHFYCVFYGFFFVNSFQCMKMPGTAAGQALIPGSIL